MSSDTEAEYWCRLCQKDFVSETALKNHAKSDHFEIYSQGDPDNWTGIIKQEQSADADLEAKAKNIVPIVTEGPTLSKETIISSMVPAPITKFADLGVSMVILKEEDDNINPPVWKRKSRAKLNFKRKADYSCVLCNIQLRNARQLRMHIEKTHLAAPKEILCDICGNKFQSKTLLRLHQRDHKEARRFSCSTCQKGFSNSNILRIHERVHSGERPYICDVCGKTFTQKAALIRHHAVHTGAKPYVCQLCNKCYTQSHSLKTHVHKDHSTISPIKEKSNSSNRRTDLTMDSKHRNRRSKSNFRRATTAPNATSLRVQSRQSDLDRVVVLPVPSTAEDV